MNTHRASRLERRIVGSEAVRSRRARWSSARRDGARRSLRGWLGLAALFGSGPALAATNIGLLPPESNDRVKWYQLDGAQPATSWDLEVTPIANASARFVTSAQVVPELACWSVNVPIGEPAGVRIRSVSGAQVSPWTASTTVPRPGGGNLVKWYQPSGATTTSSWELEIRPTANPASTFVVGAQISPVLACWALPVPITQPAWVRIRPISGTQVAPWSVYTTVPEPAIAVSSFVAVAFVSNIAGRRHRRRVRRSPSDNAVSPSPR
ncbi:MAG: hypothetical protein IPK00_26220 [Deltaproteobacteria bacterium]|nr:hypothetical protein [Deltaproteobacteria bacterium]